jgi:hypothetical protein
VSVIGLLASAVALWWLSRLSPSTTYWNGIPTPLLIFGLCQGMTTSVAVSTATRGLPADYVGAASALVSVMQQLGGSIGDLHGRRVHLLDSHPPPRFPGARNELKVNGPDCAGTDRLPGRRRAG